MGTPPGGTKATSVVGRLFATLFFGLFFAVGAVLFVAIGRQSLRLAATYQWTPTTATVLESRVQDTGSGQSGRSLYVKYHYTFFGQRYQSDRYELDAPTKASSGAYRLLQSYTRGSTHTCYVNPKNPSEAVLHRRGLATMLVALFPLIFVAVGAGGIIASWRAKSRPASAAVTENQAITETSRSKNPKWLFVLFFGVFLVLGAVVFYFMALQPLFKVQAARAWRETPCEIVSSELRSNSDSDGTTYRVDIVFRYRVDGRTYTSENYSFLTGSSSSYEWKREVVSAHPSGSSSICYVNPADPSEAVMNRGLHAEMAFGLLPLIFFAIGLSGLLWVFRRSKSATQASPPLTTTAVHASPFVTVNVAEQLGPTTLRPQMTRLGKFIGLVLVGLFWNGIVSIFVYHVFHDWARGRGSIFETLFMTPFVLVGLGMIVGAVYYFLALSNPQARLTVSRSAVRLGESLEVQWEMNRDCSRVRSLRLELEGREEATYRRGTSTSTDRSVFARIVPIDTTDPAQIRAGTARLGVPSDTMHSFKGSNNRIVWTLRVKGDIPRWPDIDDEYPIQVLPHAVTSRADDHT